MFELRSLNRESLKFENNLYAQRLMPWPALNAPFEGSWCVIEAGTASTPHAHHEYEIFIALTGQAKIVSDGKETPFLPGDIITFSPGTRHSVVNESNQPFEMYSIWWDLEMTEKFSQKHAELEAA
jgi:mannose-6-phosphate isomerase-like protein (cupin superfamily)